MVTKYKIVIIIILGLTTPFVFLKAHVTGASWEKVVDSYKVDVGYDPTTFVAGQAERLDFNILNASGESVPFSDVWVRVSQGQDTVFASGIHRLTFGLTGMIFEFPKGGDYNLNVRFENSDNTIVQTDFPIIVQAATGTSSVPASRAGALWIIAAGLIGLILGGAIDYLMRRK